MSSAFRVGLNPYGLTYTLGLQGLGTDRANLAPVGLDGFLTIARRVGARVLELDWRWLIDLPDERLTRLGAEAAETGMTVIVSTWLQHEPGETLENARRAARLTGATLIRMHLAPVLEGARAAQADRWDRLVAHARTVLGSEAARARDEGLRIGLEDHQDFGSDELLALADEAGGNVGIVFDTGNPFAVGEDPVLFAHRVVSRLVHVHLKDYRAQFTDSGFRLVRCAIGDGCVPFDQIAEVVAAGSNGHPVTASLEPAALEARHIRLFTPEWWKGYPPRDSRELAIALGRLRHRSLPDDADARTPWERNDEAAVIAAYEADHLERSLAFARQMGWM